jgi:hypothetical protein
MLHVAFARFFQPPFENSVESVFCVGMVNAVAEDSLDQLLVALRRVPAVQTDCLSSKLRYARGDKGKRQAINGSVTGFELLEYFNGRSNLRLFYRIAASEEFG